MDQSLIYMGFNLLMDRDLVREKISKILKDKNLSIEKVEKDYGIGATVLRNFLTGKTKNPKIETLSMFSKAIGIELSELIGTSNHTQDAKNILIWNKEIFVELCIILDEFMKNKNITLNNKDAVPILIELYYIYCNKYKNDIDKEIIELFFKKFFEKNK